MLAVTFHQNDNIRELAIQLPLVVDILQSKSCVGVPLQPCIFVRFFGVCIVLGLVSGQIELDDGLQNTIFHVGRRVAQVKAAGDLPVCLAVAGCLALDGDKVCGNVESRKIILCNGGQGLGRNLGSVVVGDVHHIVRVDKLDAYPQSARILDLWYAVAVAGSLICGVARDAPALGHLIVIHNDRLVLIAVIFSLVGTYNSAKLVLQLIRDGKMHRGNLEGRAVRTGLVGGCFPHTGDDGVFRAGNQVFEKAASLPVCPIVYEILPGTVFCY